jgi:hypothetical protein
MEHLIGVMQSDRSPEPTAPVLAEAIARFQPELILPSRSAPDLARWLTGLKQTWGRLVFDSLADPAFAHARGLVAARRLRFESDGCELDLALERRQGRFEVLGQVAQTGAGEARALTHVRVQVFAGQDRVAESTTDALGEFACQVPTIADLTLAVLVPPQAVIFTLPAGSATD